MRTGRVCGLAVIQHAEGNVVVAAVVVVVEIKKSDIKESLLAVCLSQLVPDSSESSSLERVRADGRDLPRDGGGSIETKAQGQGRGKDVGGRGEGQGGGGRGG